MATPIANSNAEQDTGNRNTVCQRTGFRVKVKEGLVREKYTGLWVRRESYEPRNEQLMVKSRPESQRGSIRPEADDNFIDSISDGSTL